MEPQHNNYESHTELPQPVEVASGQNIPEQAPASRPEVQGNQMPILGPPTPQGGLPGAPDPQTSQAVPLDPAPIQSDNTSSTSSLMADDADLIEKEWVIKAKSIVMQTRDDPYNQNREMNKVKADYLKKRYNKDLKISET